ncbi:PatB family C-S lyase [Desulfatiferula olefinivorans]
MPVYDFDRTIDRTTTASLKWEAYRGRDVIPLWVADMDFPAPASVIEALHRRVDHGIFGYTLMPGALTGALVRHLQTVYLWTVDPSWIIPLPGVVSALFLCCRVVGDPAGRVIVPTPVYPPFLDAPGAAGRIPVRVPMVVQNGRLTFDWERLDEAVTPDTRLFLLCSPHNPGGTVFQRDELRRLADLALRHDLIICSDEIHSGLVFSGRHHPLAAACPDIADRVITLMAPSKTFNIPGLGFSFAVIADPVLRKTFMDLKRGLVPEVSTLGYTAALAAYTGDDPWLTEVLDYLVINRDLACDRIAAMDGLSVLRPESTYLAWIDARGTGLDDPAGFFETAGVGLSDGRYFGAPGFLRLNFGCPRSLLTQALTRMERALAQRS